VAAIGGGLSAVLLGGDAIPELRHFYTMRRLWGTAPHPLRKRCDTQLFLQLFLNASPSTAMPNFLNIYHFKYKQHYIPPSYFLGMIFLDIPFSAKSYL